MLTDLGSALTNALDSNTSNSTSEPIQASQHFMRRLNRSRIHIGNSSKACVSAFISTVLKVKVSILPIDPKSKLPPLTEFEEDQAPPDAEDALAVAFVAKRILNLSRKTIDEQRILFSSHLPSPLFELQQGEGENVNSEEGKSEEGTSSASSSSSLLSSSIVKSPREIAEEHAATLRSMSSDINLALPSSISSRFNQSWESVQKMVELKNKQRVEDISSENEARAIELQRREEELAAAAAATAAIEKAEAAAARSKAKRAEAAKISDYMRSPAAAGAGGRRGSRLGSAMALQAALAAAEFDMEAITEAAAKHAAESGVPDVALREALILDRRTQSVRNKLVSSNVIKTLTASLIATGTDDEHDLIKTREEIQNAVRIHMKK
jgi:hypothetical protein